MEKKVYVSPRTEAIQLKIGKLMQTPMIETSGPDGEVGSRETNRKSSWDNED